MRRRAIDAWVGYCGAILAGAAWVLLAAVTLAEEIDPLDGWLAAARTHNPDTLRGRAEYEAARARIPQAAALPDPALAGETMGKDGFRAEQMVRASQSFPWPGTLDGRRSAAALQAEALDAEVRAIELRVAARIRASAAEHAYLLREADLVRSNTLLYRQQIDSLEQRARAGGEISELLRVEMEAGILEDELARIEEARLREAAGLDALVGVSVERAGLRRRVLQPKAAPTRDVDALRAQLRERSPLLVALARRVDAASEGIRLARLAAYPEWMIGAGYRRDTEPRPGGGRESMHEALVMLSLSVPLWSAKNQGVRDEATAMLEAARREHDGARRALEAELEVLLSRERDAVRRVILFRDDLTAKAQQAHDAVEAAYRAGNATLLDLFSARRRLLDTETAYWRAVADLYQSEAEIAALLDEEDREVMP